MSKTNRAAAKSVGFEAAGEELAQQEERNAEVARQEAGPAHTRP